MFARHLYICLPNICVNRVMRACVTFAHVGIASIHTRTRARAHTRTLSHTCTHTHECHARVTFAHAGTASTHTKRCSGDFPFALARLSVINRAHTRTQNQNTPLTHTRHTDNTQTRLAHSVCENAEYTNGVSDLLSVI